MRLLDKLLYPLRKLGDILGAIVSRIVLTVVYFFGIGPIALLGFILGKDFIGVRKKSIGNSYWHKPTQPEPTLENAKKSY